MYKIYKGETVIVEGESPLAITGLSPNTDVAKGDYQVVRVDGDRESARVDIPAFKTLPIVVTGVELSPKTMTGESGTAANRQLNPTVAPENATNKEVTYSLSPETSGLTVNGSGVLAWTDAVGAGEYTITVKTTDGNKTATSTLTLSAPEPDPEPEPEPEPEEPEE